MPDSLSLPLTEMESDTNRASNSQRAGSILFSRPSPASSNSSLACSRFSLRSFFTSSSASFTDASSIAEKKNAISSLKIPRQSTKVTAKLVFGISRANCKPGLLFTDKPNGTPPSTAQLVFLPFPISFKNDYSDLPSTILKQLLAIFSQAKAKIPSSSRFSEAFSDKNETRLQELLEQTYLWEKCGQIDGSHLIGAKMHTLDHCGEDSILERLLQQPNVFSILQEATEILACTKLGIPSPRAATPAKNNSKLASAGRRSSSPFDSNHTERAKQLQTGLNKLSSDSIISVDLCDLDRLIDNATALHIPLYTWYSQYEDSEELVDTISSVLEECFSDGPFKSPAEKDKIRAAGASVGIEWSKAAASLGVREQEFNVWCLALQRCRQVKASKTT